jgi:RIO kinase 1
VHDFPYGESRYHRGKWRFDDDEPTTAKRVGRRRALPSIESFDATDGLPEGDRWTTWDQSVPTERGPKPYPEWLVTELAAVDTELGILKTGKEADVFLLRRGVPQTGRSCLLAAKRYRSAEHRMFHRDSGYLEGRRTRESRVNRAMASRSTFGRQAIAGQWAAAEFNALARLYAAGVPVPYPVQILDTELLLEFIGSPDGIAAPRLAETRPGLTELAGLWDQLVQALVALARRLGARRPVGVQPAGPRGATNHDRPTAGGRRDREPAGRFLPHPRRGERRPLVHRARPSRGAPRAWGSRRPAPPGGPDRHLKPPIVLSWL